MVQLDVVVQNPTGLHARPAKVLVKTAKQFKSNIRIQFGDKKANAKSMISLLTLGAESGSALTFTIDGEDEDAARQAIEAIVADGFGEGELIEAHGSAAPAKPAAAADKPAPTAPKSLDKDRPSNPIRGVSAAPGMAIGPLHPFERKAIAIETTFAGVEQEEQQLQQALDAASDQLRELREQIGEETGAEQAAIFDAHLELVNDPDLLEAVSEAIAQKQSAAAAWKQTIEQRAQMMASLADATLAGRATDLRDIGSRVLRLLSGVEASGPNLPDHPVVLVAHELTPSDTASLPRDRVLGFCTAAGGPTAHAAIIARALNLPAVVGAGPSVLKITPGTTVILDGTAGTLTVDPDAEALSRARDAQKLQKQRQDAAKRMARAPAITKDGHHVEVAANIGGLDDAVAAAATGAEGVGLLRTEFLFLGRPNAPTEEEQFEVYRGIAEAMQGMPVVVRTLDVGGDKPLPYIDVEPEENPFLGERGIRLCLNRPELLREQLRAILRASAYGTLRIMFPMVADIREWRRAREMVEEVRAEVGADPLQIGIMIEVPSAALMADKFAPEIDFFSVGTNDLTQYTLAMDRQHPVLASQSDGLHPAVLRLISKTVEAAHAHGKWVGVCGALGSDPAAAPILIGLGVDELSVTVPAVADVKAQVRELSFADARQLAQRALDCATPKEVRALRNT